MDVAGHYAELQGALICYFAQPSVKSPRRPERPQIPLLRFYFYQCPSSLPSIRSSIHPPVIRPGFPRPGPLCGGGEASGQAGRRAGQLQRSAGAWCAHVCRAVRRGPREFRADRALLIERSWEPAVTGHWGSPKLPPELICLQCVCAIYRVLLSNAQAGEKS